MFWFKLSLQSMRHRKTTVLLTLMMVAMSSLLWFSIETIRFQSKQHFANTLTGSHLIVGARTGATNLLLYSVFRIGSASNNITYANYQRITKLPMVDWHIPIALGDSHKQFRVIGTNDSYLEHYQYGNAQHLSMADGLWFDDVFDVVLGEEVAKSLGYQLGDDIVLAHGMGDVSFSQHENTPFRVSGILAPTGTPVDQSLHISLHALEAMHHNWQSGRQQGQTSADVLRTLIANQELEPKAITAGFIGLKSPLQVFNMQRTVNNFNQEPLMAIVPGIALQELWQSLAIVEQALILTSFAVVVSGVFSIVVVILASLNARRREIAILRTQGAQPLHISTLLTLEAFLIALGGLILGFIAHWLLLFVSQSWLLAEWGIALDLGHLPDNLGMMALSILGITLLFSLIPSGVAYRQSLAKYLVNRT